MEDDPLEVCEAGDGGCMVRMKSPLEWLLFARLKRASQRGLAIRNSLQF
jgi:hypothetical protein